MRNLLNALSSHGLKQIRENKFMCRCPAHEDRSPSLTVTVQPNEKTLVHCFAGCRTEEIINTLGLQMGDLFPSDGFNKAGYKQEKTEAFHRSQFMSDYVLIALADSDSKKGKPFSAANKTAARDAINRINKYEFDAHEVYEKLIKQEYEAAVFEAAFQAWNKTTQKQREIQ